MATHDYVIANGTGAAVRSDLNDALAAIVSNNSGTSEPATTYAYQWWADTTANVLKIRNSANNAWITLRELDGTMLIEDGSASAPGLAFAGDIDTGIAKNGTNGLMVTAGGVQRFSVSATEVNVNDTGAATDFRVESDTNTAMLIVDGSANRVGIGAATPAATLDVAGNQIFSAADPQIQFNAGGPIIKLPAANTLSFFTDSTNERARIDSSGRLLVGTSTSRIVEDHAGNGPTGRIQIEATNSDAIASIISAGTSDANRCGTLSLGRHRNSTVGGTPTVVQDGDALGAICFAGGDGTDMRTKGAKIVAEVDGTPGSNDMPGRLVFSTTADGGVNPSERVRIDSSGKVGLGETSPDTMLHIKESNTGKTGIFIQNSNGATNSSADLFFGNWSGSSTTTPQARLSAINTNVSSAKTDLAISIYDGNNTLERARIDGDGRLLVGTSSAASTTAGTTLQSVHADGSSLVLGRDDTSVTNGNLIGAVRFFANDPSGYNQVAKIICDADGAHAADDYPTRLEFYTTGDGASTETERMRIANDGRHFTFSAGALTHRSPNGANSSDALFIGIHSGTSTTSGGTASFYVRTNGNVENTNNSYGAISDAKLKENIVDASSQWDDIKDLRVRNYNFIEGQTHTQLGVVAQEVETVSPGLVTDSPDLDEEGNDLGTVTKSVNYSVLYMKAVKALQEAMDRIETLETKVAALEAG